MSPPLWDCQLCSLATGFFTKFEVRLCWVRNFECTLLDLPQCIIAPVFLCPQDLSTYSIAHAFTGASINLCCDYFYI